MKKGRVLAIIAAAAVLAAFLLELIQVHTQPAIRSLEATEELKQQEKTLYPYAVADVVGYDVTQEGLVPVTGDPQLYLKIYDEAETAYAYFHFSRKAESGLHIQIFYPDENGVYGEARSVTANCPEGADFWAVELPRGQYPALRIDIDGGVVPMSSLGVGLMPPKTELHREGMHPGRVVFVALGLFAVLGWMTWFGAWSGLKRTISGALRGIREGGRKSLLCALVFPASAGAAVLLMSIWCALIEGSALTGPRIVFACVAGVFAGSLFVFRKTLRTQPEYLFLLLVLCTGFLLSSYVPHTGLNSWDEDYHFRQALNASYVDSVMMTPQDELTVARSVPASYDLNGGIEALHAEQDRLYRSGATGYSAFPAVNAIPEVFNGIGLFLGRALGLRYYMIHFLGRFTGLAAYALLGFFGIRKLRSGKMIAAVTLLIPTMLFLASSYNYDSYLVGFTALGLCRYMALWQDREAKVTLKDAVIMIGSIAVGCLTKAVYIPFLWILILLPRDRFREKKHHTWFIAGMVLATCAVLYSYLQPFLFAGSAPLPTDSRGGSDVNAAEQIRYILGHPVEAIRTFWEYTAGAYLNLGRAGELYTNFAYIGILPNAHIYLALLAAAAFTDKNEYDAPLVHRPWAHIWPLLVALALVLIAEMSMYIAFTPVGAGTIAGAQFRYIIPAILPAAMHIGSGRVENRMDRGWYNGLVLGAAAAVNFACVYNGYISRYF